MTSWKVSWTDCSSDPLAGPVGIQSEVEGTYSLPEIIRTFKIGCAVKLFWKGVLSVMCSFASFAQQPDLLTSPAQSD